MKRIFPIAFLLVFLPSLSIADPQLDSEPGVQPRSMRGVQGAVGMTPLEVDVVSGGGGADPATATLQTALNALIVTMDAVLDLMLVDLGNIATSVASVDGKLVDGNDIGDVTNNNAAGASAVNIQDGGNVISIDDGGGTLTVDGILQLSTGASSSTLQTNLNALIVTMDAVLDLMLVDLGNISSDQATQTTLAEILAKIIAAPSTETKQDDNITQVTAIELNTDTGTGLGEPFIVSCLGTATVIDGVDVGRRELIMQNAANSKIYIGGPAVTTTIGLIINGGQVAADGKGGILIMDSTGAMSCITDGGTEILRVWELKD